MRITKHQKQAARGLAAVFLALLLTGCGPSGPDAPWAEGAPGSVSTPEQGTVIPVREENEPPRSEEPETGEPVLPPESLTEAELYRNILLGTGTFFSTDAGKEVSLDKLYQVVSDDLVPAEAAEFSVIDLDGDGTDELVLQLTVNRRKEFGYEILHCQEGRVYGYTKWAREFMDLKEDGTFSFSGGASNNGFGSLRFGKDGCTTNMITYSEMSYDLDDNPVVSYVVSGKSADADEFQTALDAQESKVGTLWYVTSDSNIELALG